MLTKKCHTILLPANAALSKHLPRNWSANFEFRADGPETRPWQSQMEPQVLPMSSEQAKDSRPNIDRVSSKESSLSGQSLRTITSTRIPEEVPFDDPWNGLATPQTRGPQSDRNNSSVADLNTVSTLPIALKDVSQVQNAIQNVPCLPEQKYIHDQLTLNAFENEKGKSFGNPPF